MTAKQTKAQLLEQNAELGARLLEHAETVGLLTERFAELELALEDANWIKLSINADKEFSRDGLRRICTLARLSFLKNPLINHAVMVQAHYVWGQGVNINAVDPEVNKVVQEFLDDPKNKKELTGHMALIEKEIDLQTSANIFLVLFTDPSDGKVRLRSIPQPEVDDIITDPDDTKTPWYYCRKWSQRVIDPVTGNIEIRQFKAYYPDWQYNPESKPASWGGHEVKWDSPVYHIKVGGFSDMRFGVPEVYSALDWAKAVKEDMEDYATIRRALSRFAWRLTTQGGKAGVASAKERLTSSLGLNSTEKNPPPTVGSVFIGAKDGAQLDPIKTAGTTIHPDEGRRMWLLVSAGTGIPETILSGDANVGNYATSRTLDRPTELQMRTRQTMWADVFVDILGYVVAKARNKVNGALLQYTVEKKAVESTKERRNGHVSRHVSFKLQEASNVSVATGTKSKDGGDVELHVDFPPILEHDPLPRVQAIVQAATLNGQTPLGVMSDKTLVRLLLVALGEDDVDEQLAALSFDEKGMLNELRDQAGEPVEDDGSGNMLPTGGRSNRARGRQALPNDKQPERDPAGVR